MNKKERRVIRARRVDARANGRAGNASSIVAGTPKVMRLMGDNNPIRGAQACETVVLECWTT